MNFNKKIRKIGRQTRDKCQYLMGFGKNEFKCYKDKKKIFYMLVPIHGNLGDQAIAYASIKYLKDNMKEYEIIEVNSDDVYKLGQSIKRVINKDDLIILHGGGNLGTHYTTEEEKRRFIVKTFNNNKIISFTQTMFFKEDEDGIKELTKTKDAYNSHGDFTILAREDKSFDTMKKHFTNCNIIKCPDIVFYLNNKLNENKKDRKYITTLLRKDEETYIELGEKEKFIQKLKQSYNNVLVSDTVINKNVFKPERKITLYQLWNKMYESKIVVTDRLHGMIFCAITKTPCIVTRSLDHKVVESYKWIKDLNYIKMVDDLKFEKINPIINELLNLDKIDNFDFDNEYFNGLIKHIDL